MRLWWYRLLSKWYWLEEKLQALFVIIVAILFVLAPIFYVACHIYALTLNGSGDFERRLIDYINSHRENKLSLDASLHTSAQQCSEIQRKEGVVRHCGKDLPMEEYCGEAVAVATLHEFNLLNYPEYIAQGFLDSKPHREILLNPVYRRAGVGVACYTPGYGLPPLPVCYVTVRVCP